METKVEVLEGNRAKVSVTVDKAEVTERIKKQYKEFANKYNFPGFRKGKAPRPVIDNMLGKDYARASVTDEIVNNTYPLAIDESGLYPIGQPTFDENMELASDKQDFTYTFEIDTKPTLELNDYAPAQIEMPAEEATEAEIDREIDALLEHYFDIVEAPANTKVKEDKFVDIKVSATDDNGDPIEAINTDGMQYAIGSGLFPAAFDDELIGMKQGETKQFTIDMPPQSTAMTASVMGKTAKLNFDVEILAVKKKSLPELTDEWVKNKIGIDDVATLRQELADEINSQKSVYIPRMKEAKVLADLGERLEGEVPEGVIEEAEATLLQDFFQQLQRQGSTLDKYLQAQGITAAQFRADIKQQATDVARQDLALDAWAAHEGLEVTDEDVRTEFVKSGASDPTELFEEWKNNGQLHLVRQGLLRQKAVDDAVAQAVVIVVSDEVAEEEEIAPKHARAEAAEEIVEAAEEPVEAAEEAAAEVAAAVEVVEGIAEAAQAAEAAVEEAADAAAEAAAEVAEAVVEAADAE